jgi:hypothetical protein
MGLTMSHTTLADVSHRFDAFYDICARVFDQRTSNSPSISLHDRSSESLDLRTLFERLDAKSNGYLTMDDIRSYVRQSATILDDDQAERQVFVLPLSDSAVL